jgi:hypothetical protein
VLFARYWIWYVNTIAFVTVKEYKVSVGMVMFTCCLVTKMRSIFFHIVLLLEIFYSGGCVFVINLGSIFSFFVYTRWFKYDRDKLWLVYTQIVPVIFEPPCIYIVFIDPIYVSSFICYIEDVNNTFHGYNGSGASCSLDAQ